MIEVKGDIWHVETPVLVITTNGDINKNGRAVMGRGLAKQATKRIPGIEMMLAASLRQHGNNVSIICEQLGLPGMPGLTVVSYPVKHHWYEDASIGLVLRSAIQLRRLADEHEWSKVVLTRPGCGNGRLQWSEVKPLIERQLDERFSVVELELV